MSKISYSYCVFTIESAMKFAVTAAKFYFTVMYIVEKKGHLVKGPSYKNC